jgi:hypothetical protein
MLINYQCYAWFLAPRALKQGLELYGLVATGNFEFDPGHYGISSGF